MISEKVKDLEQENLLLKAQLKELEDLCENKTELLKNCEYCKNFIQHYIRIDGIYVPICDGHCIEGNRVKPRKTGDTCKSFVKRTYGKNFL